MRRKWGDQIFEGERESEREKERNGDFKAMEKNYHFEERGLIFIMIFIFIMILIIKREDISKYSESLTFTLQARWLPLSNMTGCIPKCTVR